MTTHANLQMFVVNDDFALIPMAFTSTDRAAFLMAVSGKELLKFCSIGLGSESIYGTDQGKSFCLVEEQSELFQNILNYYSVKDIGDVLSGDVAFCGIPHTVFEKLEMSLSTELTVSQKVVNDEVAQKFSDVALAVKVGEDLEIAYGKVNLQGGKVCFVLLISPLTSHGVFCIKEMAMAKEYQAGETIFLTGPESEMSKIKQIVTDLAHSKY